MNVEVYILYSQQINKYYTGISKFRNKRVQQHIKEKNHWTKNTGDWKKIWSLFFDDYAQARILERKIKKRGAKRFLKDNNAAPLAAG